MGKKPKITPLEEALARVWCYYCERDFDDAKVLQDHQRAKHFKCHRCARRLNTINGLRVHTEQVHKASITEVENCTIPERNTLDREIFGMEGIPPEDLKAYEDRLRLEYFKRDNEWLVKTGNPVSGPNPNANKRKHNETPEEARERVRALKRQKEAEKQAKKQGNGPDSNDASNTDTQKVHPDSANSGVGNGIYVPGQPTANGTTPYPTAALPNYGSQGFVASTTPYAQSFAASPTPHSPFIAPPHSHLSASYPVPLPQPLGQSGQQQPYALANPPGSYSYTPGAYGPKAPSPYPTAYNNPLYQQPIPSRPHGNKAGQPTRELTQSPSGSAKGSSIAAAATLPTRPTFDTPDIGREAMEKIHAGQHQHNGASGLNPNLNHAQPSGQGFTPAIEDLDDLIAEGMAAAHRDADKKLGDDNSTVCLPGRSLDEDKNSQLNASAIETHGNDRNGHVDAAVAATQLAQAKAIRPKLIRSKTDWARRVKAPEELRKSNRFDKFKHPPGGERLQGHYNSSGDTFS